MSTSEMGLWEQDEIYPLYPRFSFGPGQRYGSKGCYIVQLARGPKPELIKKKRLGYPLNYRGRSEAAMPQG
ncbi:MAG: hypothetical protein M0Z67_07390 [Nitrospiraceae bacterium]|nr:hypothetical protein [Nitrospiraceae bacterium]